MTDRPVIMSGPMVLALLREARAPGTGKTMTRRLAWTPGRKGSPARPSAWRDVSAGDRLWVRESLCQRQGEFLGIKQDVIEARYAADEAEVLEEHGFNVLPWWQNAGSLPSIFMPRWASRLTLIVTATRAERLRDISEADAIAEGVDGGFYPSHAYAELWNSLHGPGAWDANPDVIVVSFAAHERNIDQAETKPDAKKKPVARTP